SLRLRVVEAPPDAPGSWDVHGVLRSESVEVPLAEVDGLLAGGYALARGILGRVDDGGASSWLGMLVTHRQIRITPPRRAACLEELYSLPAPPPLDLPGRLALPEVAPSPTPRLRVHPPDLASPPALFAELSFDYEGVIVPARKPGRVAFDGARLRLLR